MQSERRERVGSAKAAKASSGWIATPWGRSTLVERVLLKQRSGDKSFSSVVELLETERGERLVRFAYTTDGVVRRGPVTLRGRDLDRLRRALVGSELADLLGIEAA